MDFSGICKGMLKFAGALCLCTGLVLACPKDSQAAARQAEVKTRSSYVVKIEAPSVDVYTYASEFSGRQGQVMRGQTYEVLSGANQGWVKIRTGGREGFIRTAGNATVVEKARESVDENIKKRRQVVEYAMQFVGGRYVYGGADPNRGADCSGFTRYIMQHAAGISLSHSSRAQSGEGRSVSYSDRKPGDLIFYGGKGYINHVAMYIGNGQIVHASTERTGIKISNATYRTPVKVVRVLD